MSIINQTEPDKLVSMLRSEVGEIIQAWIVLNIYDFKARELQSDNVAHDMQNKNLQLLNLVRDKFKDDIISRLSELSSSKHGRLNFNFAADKFKIQKNEIKNFSKFLNEKHINFRRNKNIAHKEMSPTWKQIDPKPVINKCVLLHAITWSISIMKQFDRAYYGEDYRKIWKMERKRRYDLDMPAAVKYLLLPFVAKIE
jgi:hypothetical protein